MTYKINPIVEKIQAPIILRIGASAPLERRFSSGGELANTTFDKKYLIDSISAKDDAIVIAVTESKTTIPTNWIGEEMVSFF